MCSPNPDEPWECDECIDKLYKDPNAILCKKCYEFGKANADSIIRNTWAWGKDLEPYGDEIKKEFLKGLEKHKPITLRAPNNTEGDNMKNKIPNRLPTITYRGKEYFIDFRLREFRTVKPPLEFVPFDSELGRKIDNSWGD